jgi:hypothetical protein
MSFPMAAEFDAVNRVAGESFAGRILHAAGDAIRAAAPGSRAGQLFMRARTAVACTPASERIRLAGIALTVAVVTHDALVAGMPAVVRPGIPLTLRLAIALAGVVMILVAPALARAWSTSRIRAASSRIVR